MINLNHTSDRLNFRLAAEKVRPLDILVESVIIADDVSLLSDLALVKARGLGGNIQRRTYSQIVQDDVLDKVWLLDIASAPLIQIQIAVVGAPFRRPCCARVAL